MTSSPVEKVSAETVLDEHSRLKERLASIDRCAGHPLPVDDAWAKELQGMLRDLARQLKAHFAGEEDSDLYNEVRQRRPQLADRLDRLGSEHAMILKAVEDAASAAETVNVDERDQVAHVKAQVMAGLAALLKHEAEENEIVMTTYWEDVGGSD